MSDHEPQAHPERVLISYSHDSPAHQARVLELARRLREDDGVFVMLDRYDPHPAEGWPQWMRREIAAATHVLIVCTEAYLRRVDLREAQGRGLGATWEGNLVILANYAAQRFNDKFIPVVFSPADQAFVPDFLQGVTRYDVSTEEGYEALYARLTGQPLVPVPPLGPRRRVGPAVGPLQQNAAAPARPGYGAPTAAVPDLVLIEAKGVTRFVPAERIQEQGSRAEFILTSRNSDDSAFLSELKAGWSPTRAWVAYGDSAHEGSVEAADRARDASGEHWTVTVTLNEQKGGYLTEVSTSGKSVDEIAELRARRILLNERPPAEVTRWGQTDTMLEMLVQGLSSSGRLAESPIPALYRQLQADSQLFLAAARLMAVLELRRTDTVEHVLELSMVMEDPHRLHVRFRGRRQKMYTNVPAHEIAFEGTCLLQS